MPVDVDLGAQILEVAGFVIEKLAPVIGDLINNFLTPLSDFFSNTIIPLLQDFWNNILKPIIEGIKGAIGGVNGYPVDNAYTITGWT